MRTLFYLILLVLLPLSAFASSTNGTIDSSFKMVKLCKDPACTSYDRVNWKPTLNVNTNGATAVNLVTNTGITGWLWGDTIGWVNLNPTGAGVSLNSNTGALTGKAFSQSGGWINFSPTQVSGGPTVGVTVNSNGEFTGWAYVSGGQGGWLKFDCTDVNSCVKTDWRPTVASAQCADGIDNDGDSLIDLADSGCANSSDTDETNVSAGGGGIFNGGGGGGGGGTPTPTPTPAPGATPIPDAAPTGDTASGGTGTPVPQPAPTGGDTTPASTPAPEGTTPLDLDLSTLTVDVPAVYTTSGSVRVYSSLRTVQVTMNGSTNSIQRDFFEVTQGKKLRVALPYGNERPVKVTTSFRFIGDAVNNQRTIYIEDSFFHRMKKFLLLALESVVGRSAYAALVPTGVFEDYIQVPSKPGTYEMYVTSEYPSGTTTTTSSYGVIVSEGQVFYKPALFLDYSVFVPNASVTLHSIDPATGQKQVWQDPAPDATRSPNPRPTNADGTYSFIVNPGSYSVSISTPTFDDYTGEPFVLQKGKQVVNDNIEMICRPWSQLTCQWDAKLILLILLIAIGGYIYSRRMDQGSHHGHAHPHHTA